ncbi:UT14A protein, partial [Centropus bengalensis]|nr:UT14A protein [Centropus bengalensis]
MAEDWLGVEAAPSASDGEEEEDGERRHRQLLEAVSSLSGRRRRKLAERTEASVQVSEFNVSCKGAGEKLVLSELLQPIRPKSALSSVRKELSKVKKRKAVELPLSKEEAERVVREAAYAGTSKDVAKWKPVVLQNRRAEQLVFPLKQEIATVVPLEQVAAAWKARTPLEQEIFELLHRTGQPTTDPLLTPKEMASLQAMSLEEARQRRAELQRARAIQSYYEAKARREKRIKSKKYHRILKKSRRRKALKEFEQLHKSDPEAALEKLKELEQLRMQERMSLKHQNKGKWARSRAIMAKYDLEARKAMQEQLARSKELMQKVQLEPPEEEEETPMPEEDLASVPVAAAAPGANPWMLGKPSNPAEEPKVEEALGAAAVPAAVENEEEMDEEEEVSEEEALLQDFAQRRRARQQRAESPEGRGEGARVWVKKGERWGLLEVSEPSCALLPRLRGTGSHLLSQCAGADETQAVPELLGGDSPVHNEEQMSQGLEEPPEGLEEPPEGLEEPLLSQQLNCVRTMEEVEALASEERVDEQEKPAATRAKKRAQQPEEGRAEARRAKKTSANKKMISLQAVLAGKPQPVPCSLPVVVEEEEDGSVDQRGVITEAFAGDDVVADFRREKRKAEQAGKPQPVNLVLPGWGEWGGTGLKPSTKKVKRFLLKPAPAPPRKDQHLPHVIMSERRNIYAAAHQVSELPFPFERHQQFEQSIRTPLGSTWNTQRAFQKLTAPRVITRAGHIIQPISAEDIPAVATAAGTGAKVALETVPEQQAQPFGHRRRRAR